MINVTIKSLLCKEGFNWIQWFKIVDLNLKSAAINKDDIATMCLKDFDNVNAIKILNDGLVKGLNQFSALPQNMYDACFNKTCFRPVS